MKQKISIPAAAWMAGLSLCILSLFSHADTLRVQAPTDENGTYSVAMLKLALSKYDNNHTLEFVDTSNHTQTRTFGDVANNKLDITWTATDQELENQMEPIRIPLYKGLLGHRILIIRNGDQARFDKVKTFDDLKQFTFGQGKTWPDYKILTANGLKAVPAMKYESLFFMLDGSRFDAFPRGVQEPWAEIQRHPQLQLTTEKRIMFVYRMPFYLFTNKAHAKLARELEQGFDRAIADGSFDKLFYSSPTVHSVMENANLDSRLIFELKNPTLPKQTPVDHPEYWLNIEEFKRHSKEL